LLYQPEGLPVNFRTDKNMVIKTWGEKKRLIAALSEITTQYNQDQCQL
jgi:hypothetical protein